LRREGRRKRKAGAKNEKAILLYQQYFAEVKEKITQISKRQKLFLPKNTHFLYLKSSKIAYLCDQALKNIL
jgi:hypothetical protein